MAVMTSFGRMTSCWEEMWGRDGVVTVATGHLGWRLVEMVGKIPGVGYGRWLKA
jgi:hypothetical protein